MYAKKERHEDTQDSAEAGNSGFEIGVGAREGCQSAQAMGSRDDLGSFGPVRRQDSAHQRRTRAFRAIPQEEGRNRLSTIGPDHLSGPGREWCPGRCKAEARGVVPDNSGDHSPNGGVDRLRCAGGFDAGARRCRSPEGQVRTRGHQRSVARGWIRAAVEWGPVLPASVEASGWESRRSDLLSCSFRELRFARYRAARSALC